MHDSRKINQEKEKINIFTYKKLIINFVLCALVLSVLFFPSFYGNLIGNWIKDFLGNIISIVKTIK